MIHFIVAFALLLHVLFWGAGAAIWAMPRPWRRFWPVLVPACGFALQSAVVWAGALAGWAGARSYGWWAEIVPAVLLVTAWRRRGGRAIWVDLNRFGAVALGMAGCLAVLVLPLGFAAKGLTTISLGSCDAADYAGGARVLLEFARGDRGGFLGLTEVVQVQSVDNFFDYWVRLNHFTPAALIAFNGAILDCAPHELTSLVTMVLLAGSLPVVFWVARAVIGYSGGVSLVIAVVYGVNPVTWYAVAHVAPGQLLAAQAIALITWAGIALWRGRLTARRAGQFAAVLAAAYWLVLGSYNFIVLVCLVPAVAFAGGRAVWRGEWRRLAWWGLAMVGPLAAMAVVFWGRAAGLVERFRLLRTYDFGWRIPALGPEGWVGMVSGPALEPWRWFGLRWALAALIVGAFGWAMVRAIRRRHPGGWTVTALIAPVLAGYAFLEWRGARLGTNASYDAYKLLAVFYPLVLPACCWWVTLRRSRRLTEWFAIAGLGGVVVAANVVATGMFVWRLAQPPLFVDGELRQLRKIEAMPDVASVNVLLPGMWERLWANALLLRKPQYFLTHTYEGRLNTPLRGDWDLEGGLLALHLPGAARKQITPHYALVDRRSPLWLGATLGGGWHPEEKLPATGERWQWTRRDAIVMIENPHPRPLTLVGTVDARSLVPREMNFAPMGGTAPTVRVGAERARTTFPPLTIPPGTTTLVLHALQPVTPAPGAEGDARELALCVFGLALEVRE